MKTTVTQSSIHVSSQKANLVCDLIRYQSAMKALVILDNTPNKTAKVVRKLLNSAIANATNNKAMTVANLYIYEITANQGKTLKRMIPRAKGSSSSIRKRFVTLKIVLSDDKNQKKIDLDAIKARIAKRNQNKKSNKSIVSTKPMKYINDKPTTPRVKLLNKEEKK
ncbi:MAG: 50S ribosomal protein L22 [Mycoplasma sp.]|nr:50S ribosomal protein L22 [Mycoplasma sp.]